MKVEDIAARITRFNNAREFIATPGHEPGHWFHSMVFKDGTTVEAPIKSLEALKTEFDLCLGPVDLRGKSVLDIGAWDGAFSAEARRRGAARVCGADHWAWVNNDYRALERYLYVSKRRRTRLRGPDHRCAGHLG
jgi:tRNA (mo5U34)-methyltransferase